LGILAVDVIKGKLLSPLLGAAIASPISSLLPGLGSGQAAIIGNTISKADRKGFLVLLGATNTIVMGFSFISLYLVSRTRTGAAVAINELLGVFEINILILIILIVAISGIISFFLTINLAKFFSRNISKINYTLLSGITLAVLFVLVFLVSGLQGVIVLTASTLTGFYCISYIKVRRTQMMGCLLLPTIIFYLMF
jgi:putative membrane protein